MKHKPEYLIYGTLHDEYHTKIFRICSYVDLVEYTYGDIHVRADLLPGTVYDDKFCDFDGNLHYINVGDKYKTFEFMTPIEDDKRLRASFFVVNKTDRYRVIIKNDMKTIYTSPDIVNNACPFDFDVLIATCSNFHIEITEG